MNDDMPEPSFDEEYVLFRAIAEAMEAIDLVGEDNFIFHLKKELSRNNKRARSNNF